MLKRKAVTSIKNWINTKIKNVLLLAWGARSNWKNGYIRENGLRKTIMRNCLEINFKQMASAADIFSGRSPRWIIWLWQCVSDFPEKENSARKNFDFFFLDEIQECRGSEITSRQILGDCIQQKI
ncbi:MAG: hypothetical protein ACLR78_01635 [Roseburia sp.]